LSNKSISRTGIAQFFCSPSEATNCSTRNSLAPAKLIGFVALTFLAFGTRTVESLALLTAVDLALLVLSRVARRSTWRLTKIFLWQTAIIVFLYILRFGSFAGFLSGLKTSWQLSLAYLPGVLLVETTPQPHIMRLLSSVMHYRTAFVATTCLKFVPLVMEEIRSIHEGQLFRGAKVLPRDLLRRTSYIASWSRRLSTA
jgi:energy-coupling factor transport system permease protein